MADFTRSVRQRKHPRNPGQLDLVEPLVLTVDPYLTTLMHFNDNPFATYLDEMGAVFTGFGNSIIDLTQSKFGGASLKLDGTGDYLTTPDSNKWRLDDGANSNLWTVDFWTRFNGSPTGIGGGFFQQFVDTGNYFGASLTTASQIQFTVRSASTTIVSFLNSWTPNGNQWYHIAFVKNGTSGYMLFIDGTQLGSTFVDTDPIPNFAATLRIGRYTTAAGANLDLNGWIDEFRISKGVARWTANFTPPTSEYSIYI